MSRTTTMTLCAALATLTWATAGRAAATPADAAPVTDGDTTFATMQGMQILVKRVPGADFVAGHLYIKGGARNWGKDDAGIESLALATAAGGGTETLAKELFTRKLAHLGSQLTSDTRDDGSVLRAKSLQSGWDETFALLADAFLHPALPASEVELQRQRALSRLKREEEDPDQQLIAMGHALLYRNHPYGNRAIGTQLTMAKLDGAQLRAHLGKLRETGRLLLVVVGDVEPAHVLAQTRQAFASLPRGAYRDVPMALPAPGPAHVEAVEKKLATNYMQGLFHGPSWRDRDLATALVAMGALRFRVFLEVRTKRNLSYAPDAGFELPLELPLGYLYVTAVDPKTTWTVMLDEARKLALQPLPADELAGNKSVFLSGFLMHSESTDGQANLLAISQLFSGDWRAARTLPERIRAVTPADVQAFAKKYLHNLQSVYIGDPAQLDKKLFESL